MEVTTQPGTLANRINALEVSQTIAMAKKARELAASGVKVVNLSFGEPDFVTPAHICEAAKQAIDEGFTFYTPVPGILELRKGICDKLKEENGLYYTPDQIVVSTGAKQSIANTIMCLINPGDEVLILAPYWVSYLEIVKLAEGIPVIVDGAFENNFKPTIQQVAEAITPRTKAVMFSSPSNPTGSMFTREELSAMADLFAQHPHIVILSDEIYEYIRFEQEHVSIASFPHVKDQVVIINGFSKGFAMTGWRVGYIAAPKYIAEATDKMQGQFTSATCSIAQKAAVAAINGDKTPSYEMRDAFLRRRDMMLELMADIPGMRVNKPDGAFYLFPEVSSYFGKAYGETIINNSTDLCLYLLANAHVSTVPGSAFGNENCIRISFAAADDELRYAVANIKAALANLL